MPINSTITFLQKPWIGALIALVAFAIYANTLSHGFVLDDVSVISENRYVNAGIDGIPEIWKNSYRDGYWNDSGTLYRPVTQTIFALLWEVSPNNPALGHWLNVLLYAGLSWLLFSLFKSLTKNDLIAFSSSLLFTTTAIHTEVIANIKSLDEILSLLCALGTWLLLWKQQESKDKKLLIWASLLFLVGMFSKEGIISFLVIIPLSFFLLNKSSFKELISPLIAIAVPVVIYLATRSMVLEGITASVKASTIDNPMVNYSIMERFMTAIKLIGLYVEKLLLPIPLAYEYAFDTITKASIGDVHFLLGFGIIGASIFGITKTWKSKPLVAFGILFFFLSIGLYTNSVVLIGAMFAERFAFAASLGFYLALTLLLLQYLKPKVSLIITVVISVLFAGLTIQRNPAWKSSFSLYEADIETLESSCKAHYNYGLELMKQKAANAKNPQEKQKYLALASAQFEKALEIKPGYQLPKSQLALVQYRMGNYPKAIELYEVALAQNTNDDASWNNLAGAYVSTQQYQKAIDAYQKAIEINPNYTDALGNCGAVYGMIGNHEQAIVYLERAHQLAPRNLTYIQYLGMSHDALGNYAKAKEYSELYGRAQKK